MAKDIRICVTGLSRAGKTAFITALVDALFQAVHRPQGFAAWRAAAEGRLHSARLVPPSGALGAMEQFPYHENAERLREDPPRWPEATEKPRAVTVQLTVVAARSWAARQAARVMGQGARTSLSSVHVTVLDYPGEWVLDVPLLRMSFEQWSAATLAAMETEPRRSVAQGFLQALDRVDPAAPYDDARAIAAHEAYVVFLETCRSQHRLSLLQPGLFLRPEQVGGRAGLLRQEAFRFFPLRASRHPARKGSFGQVLAQRFEAFKRNSVQAFFSSLRGPAGTRQVVLFDLLSALSDGEHAYTDARAALAQIAEVLTPGRGWWEWLLGRPAQKVLYAVTKADHVHSSFWPNLETHLGDLLRELQAAQASGVASFEARMLPLASVACTRDAVDPNGREAVRGNIRDRETGEVRRDQVLAYPAPPPRRPTRQQWEALRRAGVTGFRFPEFVLDPRMLEDRHDLPHIHLDEAIEFLLGDHV
ncbi:YcjX family protein [Sabulicella glaciei]|uniref:YcjX family protein n=1 Tax=Sabulicella glaciei TaxID=2984948 RepID=A0ABT3NPY6_9PROT|nr:YcjX family protein [Roseococcus sp. MDT2-1-1]MCW8084197.1 YcjX family protein [Roseococcus sp. MDT2-1-1]